MKYIYLTALVDLNIRSVLRSAFELKVGTFITNNPVHVKQFLKPTDMSAIGELEANALLSGFPVIYKIDEIEKPEMAHTEIVNFLRDVQAFLTSLWLMQDNSANCELGFAISQAKPHVHSNSLTFHYSRSTGDRINTEVDLAELAEIAKTYRESFTGIRKQEEQTHTAFQKGTGRVNVSMLILQQARASDDLGQKIANYCSFLEALLSTNSAELAHQLSERAAFLIQREPAQRLSHFRKTKRAYAIRSKVVHGDIISRKQIPDLLEITRHCDQTARELIRLLTTDEELATLLNDGDSESIDNYMLYKIFGINLATNLTER